MRSGSSIAIFLGIMCAMTISGAYPLISASNQAIAGDSPSEILTRIEMFGRAYVRADVGSLKAYLSQDYIHTNTDGSVYGRDEWLGWVASQAPKIDDGTLHYEDYRNSDLRVRVNGEVAWVTGRNDSRGTRDGEAFNTSLRFTHVWVKEDGVWRRALFHDSRISAD